MRTTICNRKARKQDFGLVTQFQKKWCPFFLETVTFLEGRQKVQSGASLERMLGSRTEKLQIVKSYRSVKI